MADNLSFTVRSNANRAARRMIAQRVAPAAEFRVDRRTDGKFEIVWLTDNPGLATAAWRTEPKTPDQALDAICGAGTAAAMPTLLATPQPKPKRQPHKGRTGHASSGSRPVYAAAPMEPGGWPEKPVLKQADFTRSYQARIDHLTGLAEAGDWSAVEAYEIKGHNTYSKIVARYRAQLLAARPQQ